MDVRLRETMDVGLTEKGQGAKCTLDGIALHHAGELCTPAQRGQVCTLQRDGQNRSCHQGCRNGTPEKKQWQL